MPSLKENKRIWDGAYRWKTAGDEWSRAWGSSEMQWHASLLPRIHRYVPVDTILEIAPGYGRWTQFLKGLCRRLILVDMSEQCIAMCRERFQGDTHITYHVNDGRSLEMIDDETIDFVFSYDSLVHAEDDVMSAYVRQLARKLTPQGTGFIHHSNAGRYRWYFWPIRQIKRVRPLKYLLKLSRIPNRDHMRAMTMTAEKFSQSAHTAGLRCVSQEMINWRSPFLLDCHSVIERTDALRAGRCRVKKNRHFMDEARSIKVMSSLYTTPPGDLGTPPGTA